MSDIVHELINHPGSGGTVALAPQLDASTDLRAIVAWVESKRGSEHTRRAFRTEALRYLAWIIWVKAGQHHSTWLDKASSLDAAAYARFLEIEKPHPFPAAVLRATGLQRQPFKAGALAPASVERAISSLKTMYADMMAMTLEGGLEIARSPFARFKIKSVLGKSSPRRKALTRIELGYLEEALAEMRMVGETAEYHQIKWVWTALRWGAMRRDELARATAGDIYQDMDEEGRETWMMVIDGKGGRVASIPLAKEFMEAFAEYRRFHGLSPVPVSDIQGTEKTPLVLPLRGPRRNVHAETIYRAVKKLLGRAAEMAMECDNPAAAGRLKSFASHSARHTQVTMIVDATGDITLGQDAARHISITTTRRYKPASTSRLVKALRQIGSADAE